MAHFSALAFLVCLACALSLLRGVIASIRSFGSTFVSLCGTALALADAAAGVLCLPPAQTAIGPAAPYIAAMALWFSCSVFALDIYAARHRDLSAKKHYGILIVPGAALKHDEPSPYLAERLDACLELWKSQGGQGLIVVSGGQGADECVSEAYAMRGYLEKHGVPQKLVIEEGASTSTRENFAYARETIDQLYAGAATPAIAVVSTDYHLLRCHAYARQAGMRVDVYGASSAGGRWQRGYIREVMALTRMLLPTYAVPVAICVLTSLFTAH